MSAIPSSAVSNGQEGALGLLLPQSPDPLLGLISSFRADPRPDKIDLGVGVFRNETGATPVMRAVKAAEKLLLEQQLTKSYLGAEGDEVYTALTGTLALGGPLAASNRLVGVQTPGGTGALRLGAEFIARAWPGKTIWIGKPTWPNHLPLFSEAGLAIEMHRFFNGEAAEIDFDGMMSDLVLAKSGDVLLLHGCCHNPSGASFTQSQWVEITRLCVDRGLIPFIDLAYQGFGDGLEEDAIATRSLLEQVPTTLVAYSCDKNFGLYRERVGALWIQAPSPTASRVAKDNVLSLARSLWSMPPDHGAAVVRTILQHHHLTTDWKMELDAMRERISALRSALASMHPLLAPIEKQRGMFTLLPLTQEDVEALREMNGIYMASNGRINIAGLALAAVPAFVASLSARLRQRR